MAFSLALAFSILAASLARAETARPCQAPDRELRGAVQLEPCGAARRVAVDGIGRCTRRIDGRASTEGMPEATPAAGSDPQRDRAVKEAAGLARTDRPEVILFDIEAHTVPCQGVAPMRCLVVNGEYFYDLIDGYRHIEGQPARIYVERTERPEPLPADAGGFLYRRIPLPAY